MVMAYSYANFIEKEFSTVANPGATLPDWFYSRSRLNMSK
jgi:hypothetical protein